MNEKSKNPILLLVVLSLVLFAFILEILGVFRTIETAFLDLRMSLSADKNINPNIIRLYFDDNLKKELETFEDYVPTKKGISRAELAKLIEHIEAATPLLIMLNVNLTGFEDSALSSISPDTKLTETLHKYPNIIISTHLNNDENPNDEFVNPTFLPANRSLNVQIKNNSILKNITYNTHSLIPYSFIKQNSTAVANVTAENGVVRAAKPLYHINKHAREYFLPSVAFDAFLKIKKLENNSIIINKNKLFVGDYSFNLNNNGEIFLNLKKKGLYYPAYTIETILKSIHDGTGKFKFNGKLYSNHIFKNKIILIDEKPTNLSMKTLPNGEKFTSGELLALMTDNYLEENSMFISQAPIWLSLFLSAIFCLLIAISNLRFNDAKLALGFIFAYLLIAFLSFLFPPKIWLLLAMPLYAMLVTFILTIIFTNQAKQKKRNLILSAFKNQVSKEVLFKLLKNSEKISLKPSKKFITTMYCEIDGFTRLTNSIPSELLIERLNEVLDIIITSSLKNNGTINKLNNNSAIIYWGAPLPSGNENNIDVQNAIKTAIEIWKIVSLINEKYRQLGQFTLNLKIAVHSGEALVGNIGTDSFKSYSAFGETIDTVNKIEKICIQFKKSILISETTYELLKSCKNLQFLDGTIEFTYTGAISNKTPPISKLSLYEVKEVEEN